jgi:hypothetical protein
MKWLNVPSLYRDEYCVAVIGTYCVAVIGTYYVAVIGTYFVAVIGTYCVAVFGTYCVAIIGKYFMNVYQCVNVKNTLCFCLVNFVFFMVEGTKTVLHKLKSYHNFCS